MTDNKSPGAGLKLEKPWGGRRFNRPTDAFVERFTWPLVRFFDQRLYHHESRLHCPFATCWQRVGVLTNEERDTILEGLGRR